MSAIVTTRYGKVEGDEAPGLAIFRGIPFAAPPVGAKRWAAPEAPKGWSGTLDARHFRPTAMQNPLPEFLMKMLPIMGSAEPVSEDCLHLNIWIPGADGKRRPVMVWIHGGAFTLGSGSTPVYDGSTLARRGDVVVVTINYRLGPLGFLSLAEATGGRIPSTGNEGLLDQVAALEWVRDNIAGFGGDPGNVTIFGESAGGMSVGALMAMPKAKGLFHKAIPQSGTRAMHSPERARKAADWFIGKLGGADAERLRAAGSDDVLAPTRGVTGPDPALGFAAYRPVIDGVVVPQDPIDAVAAGSAAGIPTLVGTCADEWRLFLMLDPEAKSLTDEIVLRRLTASRVASPAAMLEAYRDARKKRNAPVAPFDLFEAIETDRVFRIPGLRFAAGQKHHTPNVYSYIFDWKSPMPPLGACHAIELGFVFGTLGVPGMDKFAGAGPEALAVAQRVQDAWLAFARTGNPSCDAVGDWPQFDESMRATKLLGGECRTAFAPLEDERRAWGIQPNEILGG